MTGGITFSPFEFCVRHTRMRCSVSLVGGLGAGQPTVALIKDSSSAGLLDACFDLKLAEGLWLR